MKKLQLALIVLLFGAALVAVQSCQSTKSSTDSKMLKFNFEKGKGYDYEMITSMDQEVMGQKMKMDMQAYYSMDVSEDDGSLKTISSQIDRFKMKMDMGMFNLDVDTDNPVPARDSADEKDPMAMVNRVFSAIKGQRFIMKVDAEGKIKEVSGFENMAKDIVDSFGIEGPQKDQMIAQFNQQFNSKKMSNQLERVWYIFPNKEVKVGDTWEKTMDMDEQGSFHSTYKVTDIEGDMVTLSEKSTIDAKETESKMTGTIDGTLVVDSRSGLIVSADQDMTIKTEAEGQKMEIKAKTKIKGKAR